MIRAIWNIVRALVTAPDVVHWIRKYEAAKEENKRLSEEIARLRGEA